MGNRPAMPSFPALVSLGEPMIEFNRPRDGDGRTWLQGFGGDTSNATIAAARQGASVGYLTSLGRDAAEHAQSLLTILTTAKEAA